MAAFLFKINDFLLLRRFNAVFLIQSYFKHLRLSFLQSKKLSGLD